MEPFKGGGKEKGTEVSENLIKVSSIPTELQPNDGVL